MVKAWRSRRCKRPAIASQSAPVSTTPSRGEDRGSRRGWRIERPWTCGRRSGEALIRNQRSPSPLTASDAWLRGIASASPARARRQASAFEFHWGNPPPAAAPRTTAFIDYTAARRPWRLQIGAGVGVDFHADGDLDDTRCFPSHGFSPLKWARDDVEDSRNESRLARQIGGDHFDVLVVKGDRHLYHGAHAAPAPGAGAKIGQGLGQVFRPLPRQARRLALAGEILLVTTVAVARLHDRVDLFAIDVAA